MKPKVVIIAGPTASGKKRLALETALRFDGEIVSADSRKVYRYLDIGTAKPAPEDRKKIPHHIIDIIDPDEHFSAGDWMHRASTVVNDIIARGRLPVISGGTGFYLTAFREGLTGGITPEYGVRENLNKELAREGPSVLYRKLASIDPARASELHEHDTVRVVRALEIFYSTGRTFTEIRENEKFSGGDYTYFTIGVNMARERLYTRINDRVDDMVSRGLVDELKSVLGRGYSRDVPALDTVGYKEWFPYLDSRDSFGKCLEDVKRNTRRYAKRQLTWFRSVQDVQWIDTSEAPAVPDKLDELEQWFMQER
ncbi:tRNA (adenosine(37)-N6)-dimethylallyltransferase MiaA [Candidatus Latescibacterota bacterium]